MQANRGQWMLGFRSESGLVRLLRATGDHHRRVQLHALVQLAGFSIPWSGTELLGYLLLLQEEGERDPGNLRDLQCAGRGPVQTVPDELPRHAVSAAPRR